MKKYTIRLFAVILVCATEMVFAQEYAFDEKDPNNIGCGYGQIGVQIAGGRRTTDPNGTERWTQVEIPYGWTVNGGENDEVVYQDSGAVQNIHCLYPSEWPTERPMPTLAIGSIAKAVHSRGYFHETTGKKFHNMRGSLKIPVCKTFGVTVDDWVDLTDYTFTKFRLRRMGQNLLNTPFILVDPALPQELEFGGQGNDKPRVGKTSFDGTATVALHNRFSAFRVAIPNPALPPVRDWNQYEDVSENVVNTAMVMNSIVQTGSSNAVINFVEMTRPRDLGISFFAYEPNYHYMEIRYEDLSSINDHWQYVIYSFDRSGNMISSYQTVETTGAALVENGRMTDILIAAYDTYGNIYAMNNIKFQAPQWNSAKSRVSTLPAQGQGIIFKEMLETIGNSARDNFIGEINETEKIERSIAEKHFNTIAAMGKENGTCSPCK